MHAANKAANYFFALVGLGCVYVGYVLLPPRMDNYQLKSAARSFISSSRQQQHEERAKKNFLREARDLGIKLPEDAVRFERLPDGESAAVHTEYVRDVEWPFLDRKHRFKFKWTVKQRFSL